MKTTILLATIMLFGNASCKHANDDMYEQPIPIVDSIAPTNVKPQLAPTIMLNNGLTMPVCGLGTYSLKGEVCFNSVYTALKDGYRLIDCAYMYGNEKELGRAVRQPKCALPKECRRRLCPTADTAQCAPRQ